MPLISTISVTSGTRSSTQVLALFQFPPPGTAWIVGTRAAKATPPKRFPITKKTTINTLIKWVMAHER
ncbi:hypothetical protein THIOM_003441 [Candidatus Thiomargarita nelsonii]|uniref:Uncharacterized protein n=1 Tax=Candidatus Thiomargarita nelsonii TaxID=1003181 RepID=A0A176RYI3_9GAMM|nr:hypothetical protein THIOM_003441 [Candidatus Thiomargarita nelsonii]